MQSEALYYKATESNLYYSFNGIVSAESAGLLKELIQQAGAVSEVHLDFSRMSRINSMGIALLLKAMKELKYQGKKIHLRGANKMTLTLFKMMGINAWATIAA